MDSNNRYHLVPKGERECIWMKAGIILYKLCDRDYQCENCPFDMVMGNEFKGEELYREPETEMKEEVLMRNSSLQISGSSFYHPNHCWVKIEDPEKVKIGVDDFLAQLIINLKAVILPRVGDHISQGEYCFHIIEEDHIIPVVSPLSGTILAVNSRLKKNPELIINDPQKNGWLVKVKPENLERGLKDLFFGKSASTWRRREEIRLMTAGNSMLNHARGELGPTMQDGGVISINHLGNLLTSEQYSQILDSFVARPKSKEFQIRKTR